MTGRELRVGDRVRYRPRDHRGPDWFLNGVILSIGRDKSRKTTCAAVKFDDPKGLGRHYGGAWSTLDKLELIEEGGR